MRNDIVRDAQESAASQYREMPTGGSLVSWVMVRVAEWEDHRKVNYDDKWDEYYRLWRGIWKSEDKSRDSERSKIINPALSQAIESTAAELEEASFGKGKWFDVSDNYNDEDKTDIAMWRDQLAEDLDKEDVPSSISEIYLNGAIFGTGIGKIILNEVTNKTIAKKMLGDTDISTVDVITEETIRVGLKPVHPKEFVIDPSARTIDEALGMAHITTVPKHTVLENISNGIYREVALSGYTDTVVGSHNDEESKELDDNETDKTMLIEYHGFVPKHLLDEVSVADDNSEDEAPVIETEDEEDLIEAIVTIANGGTLLRAVDNPYVMGDRCFVAYQHDTVPNRFWGRGIAEKGYNPQKALDAESRGRIDAMALSIHPMMAMDATRIQRGSDFKIAPGRNVFTNGDPKQILMPFQFGQVNPSTFSQTSDLERQVQMGTGALDQATSPQQGAAGGAAGSMSMLQGGSIKRSKRTLANIERRFLKPFIHKAAWRFMQFAPDRYPVQDIKFNVHSTLGIMARELEQNQLANMMKTVPSESPAFWILLKGVFEHGNSSNREEMLEVIQQMMEQSLEKQKQPPQDPLVQVKMKEIEVDAQLAKAQLQQKTDIENKELMLKVQQLELKKQELALKAQQIMLDAKVAMAGQEQDSLVTAVQMQNSKEDSIRKAVVQMNAKKVSNNGQ